MDSYSSYGGPAVRFGPRITPWVKKLIIVNVVVFVLQVFFGVLRIPFAAFFSLIPVLLIKRFFIWQAFTYMFLHSRFDIFHILFNMYALWMFGSDVERELGSRRFIRFYLAAGVFAGICNALVTPNSQDSIMGASGAVIGVLILFCLLFPYRRIMLILPPVSMYARTLALIFIGLEVLFLMSGTGGNVARLAHLGGALFAFLYFKNVGGLQGLLNARVSFGRKGRPSKADVIREEIDPILEKVTRSGIQSLTWWEKWKLKRAHRKMKKM